MHKITFHDVLTGETITRDMNEAELAQYEADKLRAARDAEAKLKSEEVRDRKRQEILDRLGITFEELKTILS